MFRACKYNINYENQTGGNEIKNNKNRKIATTKYMKIPIELIRAIIKSIKPLKPSRALIFGSAIEKGLNARDIDILITSKVFKNVLWQHRYKLLNLPQGPTYDLRLFTPLEFEKIYPIENPFRQTIENNNINLVNYYD